MIKVTCDICKQQVANVQDEAGAKRTLGFHKRIYHGIVGETATPEGKRRLARLRHYRLAGLNEKQIQEREAAYALKKHKPLEVEPVSESYSSAPVHRQVSAGRPAEPLALTECPLCHCRFYFTKPSRGRKDS